jgi:hypothetical protein
MNLAPIILFTYNRLWHTEQTIKALQNNYLADKSNLIIYSDGPKLGEENNVNKVRDYIENVKGFKSVRIIKNEFNNGLAESIIKGVTEIISQYKKVIVLEDDLITSPYFLKYMNEALDFYQDKNKIWHISGWNYPIETDGLGDVFSWRVMNCWGWATWADRWIYFEKDVAKTMHSFSREDIKKLNLDGAENFWKQIIDNKKGKINTWAIFWYVTIFKKNGLCINPTHTYVQNIGLDGSGSHCGSNDFFNIKQLNQLSHSNFNVNYLEENIEALQRVITFYKLIQAPIYIKIISKIRNIFRQLKVLIISCIILSK